MTRALVTGAGARLGRAMALGLADRGFDVAVHFHSSQDEAETVAALIRDRGRAARTLRADLLDDSQTSGLVARAADALGGTLTLLVNNASIFEPDEHLDATRDDWDRHMGSNLRAPFVLGQVFARQVPPPAADPEPLAQGMIVNMIDQRIAKLTPRFATYTLAKSALWTLTQTSAQAFAPGVRVNAIAPGPTLQGPRQSAEDFAAQRAATILGRGADADQIVRALGYLIDQPSVTGQVLFVDGGQHLGWQTPDTRATE